MTVALPEPLVRSFTPDVPPQTLDVALPLYDKLDAMPLDTPEELEAFMDAWNETSCWLSDYMSKTHVATARFTDDEEVQGRWAQLVSEVIPVLTVRDDQLARKFLDSPHIGTLEDGPYAPFLRNVRTDVELFREENVPLQKRESELTNKYQQISGSWSVDFQGEERTMSAMYQFLSDADRQVRKDAWFAMAEERRRTEDELEDLFEELFALRHQMAQNAGFDNYRDYMFARKKRDYSPDACHNFAEVVRTEVMPLVEEISQRTAERLGLDSFRPWDHFAEPGGGGALTPFEDVERLEDGVERMMRRLDPELGAQFAAIRDNLDLDARPGKAQGGFMSWFVWDRRPFIFSNASGKHSDIVTLLHEAGHAFHALMASEAGARPMGTNMHPPMEFNEVASMAMELLHYETLDEFYDEEDAERAIQQHLRRVVRMFPRTVVGDQFQHWMYTHPEHTRAERRARWFELQAEYASEVDVSDIDREILETSYHGILHFFIVPFYFIEYAFAQFGALQVAMAADRDPVEALEEYKSALRLGPQRDVRGLYEAAGAKFDPTPDTLRAGMDWVRQRLQ